jgi:folate-binding protein YgfZ
MSDGNIAGLSRRGVVSVAGPDAEKWLNDLLTTDVPATEGTARYAGLLSPQGKILFDMIVFRDGGRFLFDLPKSSVADFMRRLGFYRLRANVELGDLSGEKIAVAAWGNGAPVLDGPVAPDPRLAALGYRAIVPAGADMAPDFREATAADYDAHRIALGVPEGGIDFAFGEAFPHDAAMDQIAGVDFKKGCFVGQEVVSRMQHRGTARRRFVFATGAQPMPVAGTPVEAGGKAIGVMASSVDTSGLALVRIDRAREAMDAGAVVSAAGIPVTLTLPTWATYTWPTAVSADE